MERWQRKKPAKGITRRVLTGMWSLSVLLMLFASGQALAQSQRDSLQSVLRQKKLSDGDRIMTMRLLSHNLFFAGEYGEASTMLDKAIQLARDQDDGQYGAYTYAMRAMQYRILDSIGPAFAALDSARYHLERTSERDAIGYVHYAVGWNEARNNMYHEAIKSFQSALTVLEGQNSAQANNNKAGIYSELSGIYFEWQDLDNAEKYTRLGLQLAKKSDKADALAQSLQMMGSFFEQKYYTDSTQVNLLDSALKYNKQSIAVFLNREHNINVPSQLPFTAINIANIYVNLSASDARYKDSVDHYLKIAYEQGWATNQHTVLASYHGILSDRALEENNIAQAEKHLLQALNHLNKEAMPDKNTEAMVMLRLSEINEKKGQLQEALYHYKQHMAMNQSIYDAEKMEIGKRLEAQYEAQKKEQQLAALNQQFALTKRLNTVYVILALACLLALAFLFYAFRQRNILFRQQGQLHGLEIEQINQQHRISKLSAMIEGQENERLRLARDLHDGLGGLMSGIKLELAEVSNSSEGDRPRGLLAKVAQHLDSAIDEMRRIAHSMMPELLLQYGLGEALKEYCIRFRKKGIGITCQLFNYKNDMPENRQIVLYRIVQELVNNVVKHAAAKQVLVQLQQSEGTITLTIEDDGIGFEPAKLDRKGSAGINNVKARVEYLNGTLDIQSQTGKGTSITVECSVGSIQDNNS